MLRPGCCRLLILASGQARRCVVPRRKAWPESVLRQAFYRTSSVSVTHRQRVLRDRGQRRHVTGTDMGEAAGIDRGDRDNRRPLAHRDHSSAGPAQVPAGVASPELSYAARSESANPASWKALSSPMPALSGEAASAADPGVPAGQVAGPRPPPRAAWAGRHRPRRTTRCTRHGAIPAIGPALTGRWCQRRSRTHHASGPSPQQAAHRPARTQRSSGVPASLGYERAWDLTDCPGIPGPAAEPRRSGAG